MLLNQIQCKCNSQRCSFPGRATSEPAETVMTSFIKIRRMLKSWAQPWIRVSSEVMEMETFILVEILYRAVLSVAVLTERCFCHPLLLQATRVRGSAVLFRMGRGTRDKPLHQTWVSLPQHLPDSGTYKGTKSLHIAQRFLFSKRISLTVLSKKFQFHSGTSLFTKKWFTLQWKAL